MIQLSLGTAPDFWDLKLGVPWEDEPQNFQEFACGTNGGPPSKVLTGFGDFAVCPAESSGLHEVQFRYDDTIEYWARAMEFGPLIQRTQGTRLFTYHVILSVLIDDAGVVRGLRAVTDDRVDVELREGAHGLANNAQVHFGATGWACIDLPAVDGEHPIANRLIKQDCRKAGDDGTSLLTSSRYLRRLGHSLYDPADNTVRTGLFVSTARFEIYDATVRVEGRESVPNGEVVVTAAPAVARPEEVAVPSGLTGVEAFLAGETRDCPGCTLDNADLRRRDLTGANLAGASLTHAMLHRAVLAQANLDGARLVGADLNRADLRRASLVGADLTQAIFYGGDFGGANLSGAVLDETSGQTARFTMANMSGVQWRNSLVTAANFAGSNLTGADVSSTIFAGSDLQSAVLTEAILADTVFAEARLRSAHLGGVNAVGVDFFQADLTGATLTNANLTGAILQLARTREADLTGAILTGARMPDGSTHP